MGEIVALQFRDGLAQRQRLVHDLIAQLNIEPEQAPRSGGILSGMTFCVTGTLSISRKEVQRLVTEAGGKVVGSVSAKLDVLIAGEKAGSKADKAMSLGITVWNEAKLFLELNTARDADQEVLNESQKPPAENPTLFDF